MDKHLEIRTTEHKGIKVMVRIDYDNNQVGLIEKKPLLTSGFTPGFDAKKWVFNNRGLEYMQGWLDILEAMAVAIRDAKTDLEKYQKAKAAKKERVMIDIILKKK